MEQIPLPTAGLIMINDNKLLLAYSKNKRAWYLPGGKIDKGESALEALIREIKEELNITLAPDFTKFYCHISALAYGEEPNVIMEQDCFIYQKADNNIKPSNEIEAIQFFNYEMYKTEPAQVKGVLKVFEKLRADKILS